MGLPVASRITPSTPRPLHPFSSVCMVPSTYSYWYLCAVAVGGCLVAVGAGAAGRVVAVGAAPPWVAVGLGGSEAEPPLEGMMSSVPMLMIVLVIPLASMMAWAVTPNRLAMPLSVSPA